ncbi:hypothetical protein NC661_05815 [Aquibacillus koreensis]|uniref:Uncharacterized protein n=1 Tax=Aquibacillus koreensis TaxID=279446 RepID=A0A9X3WJR0_9BACI|nr:hypothetical protein [Aquibacillus koreensis]MCT2537134.1 hypothetical protein [Aquibacillus koreensis]MDC3419883.1 hypothetical protein [Aquibacillus koreensis]
MDRVKVHRQIINYIMPFTFKLPYKEIYDKLHSSLEWNEITSSQRENMMEHIDVLVRRDPTVNQRESIGRQYELNQNGRAANDLLKNHKGIYTFHHNQKDREGHTFTFSIPSIRLFTFETHIGFVVFSIKYENNPTVDEVIDNNYFLKSFSKHYGRVSYQFPVFDRVNRYLKGNNIIIDNKKIGQAMKYGNTPEKIIAGLAEMDAATDYSHLKDEEIKMLATHYEEKALSQLVRDLVEEFEPVTFFQDYQKDYRNDGTEDRQGMKTYPSYALTYTALTMDKQFLSIADDKKKECMERTLFKMRRTYKDSYKPCARDLDLENAEQVYQAFENSYWGYSLEGLANLSFLVEDEKTNRFFESNYYGNLERGYFYLFIIALHQRYALIKLSKEATLLPNSLEGLVKDKHNQIDKLREKIAYFNLRCAFKHVSYISHQDYIYQRFYVALQIDDLMTKIESEVESLGALVDLQKEARRKGTEILIVWLTTIFAVISTVSALWTIYKDFLLVGYQRPVFYGTTAFIIVVALGVVFFRKRLLNKGT